MMMMMVPTCLQRKNKRRRNSQMTMSSKEDLSSKLENMIWVLLMISTLRLLACGLLASTRKEVLWARQKYLRISLLTTPKRQWQWRSTHISTWSKQVSIRATTPRSWKQSSKQYRLTEVRLKSPSVYSCSSNL